MLTCTFFGTSVKQLRTERHMSQQALGDQIGVSANTVRAWEQGVKKPSMDALVSLSRLFDVSVDMLLGLGREKDAAVLDMTEIRGRKLMEQFMELDVYGQTAVEEICRLERERMIKQYAEKEAFAAGDEDDTEIRYIRCYDMPSAAGVNVPIENEDYEMIPAGPDVPYGAEFAVRIQGESMMPYIQDGEVVYVDPKASLHTGDVGIFSVDGALYCKIYYVDPEGNLTLVSANPDLQDANVYVDRYSDQSVKTFGKVLGFRNVRLPHNFPQ